MKNAAMLAASLAMTALPALAQQQGTSRSQTQGCSQMELSLGLRGDQCGKLTLAELAELQTRRDNPIDRMD